ncbi:MAG: hypothetical protein ACRYGM_27050 [Janthinobacterium lividum]
MGRLKPALVLVVGALSGFAPEALAAVIEAGPGTPNPTLAVGVRRARDGDTIRLAAGTYYECAVLTQRDLVLEGVGPETRLTDATCEGKAVLVGRGDRLTVRNLTLSRARVPDHNGAGLRSEGQGLTLDRVRFENNEVGVLGGPPGPGVILVQDCVFERGGVARDQPTAALAIGEIGQLRVERSRFEGVKGTQIVSAATETIITGSTIATGVEDGAGAAVQASGALLLTDSTLALGPNAPPRGAAIRVTGSTVAVRGARLVNTTGQPAILLLNWGSGTPELSGNTVAPGDTAVSSAGRWRYEAGRLKRTLSEEARHTAGAAKRALKEAMGR